MGRIGSGPVSKISNKYTNYMQETDYSTSIIIIMIKSCYLLLFDYLLLFGQKTVARETMMLASEVKSHLVDKLKDSAADDKITSRA